MLCIKCGNEINDDKFCPGCGASQQAGDAAEVNSSQKDSATIPEYPQASLDLRDKLEKLSTEKLLQVAEKNEPIAWVVLGHRYQEGKGVEQSNSEAFKWYKKAADAGEPSGINALGLAYRDGWGVEEDDEKAAALFLQAAKQGSENAMGNYGWMLENGCGVEKNPEEGVKWYRLGAERGNAYCQYMLGLAFQYERGVEKDDVKAVYWYRKAAKQNYASALLNLGWMYDNGQGIEKDTSKGHELYVKAAELGSDIAMCNVGLNYENGIGVEKDLKQANEWYLKAAEAGNVRAMFYLGCNYEYGIGVHESWKDARFWYKKAAEKGHKEADFRANFRYLWLTDFGSHPKLKKYIKFFRTTGTVLEHKRSSETHVSGSGGGGYIGSHGGYVAPVKVNSTVITTDDIWIETENGNEEQISLTNYDVALRSGQKISIFHAILDGDSRGPYMLLVNHSDGQTHWLKSSAQFMRDKSKNIYSDWGCFGCLSCLLVFPLIWYLRHNYKIAKDMEKIVKGMDAHLLKMEAWAKKNAK